MTKEAHDNNADEWYEWEEFLGYPHDHPYINEDPEIINLLEKIEAEYGC